jgi:oleandomycin transport system ATP-binding protein
LVTDGSTVLLTTQYLDEADALADEISVIDHGKVIAHDTPTALKQIVGGQTLTVRPSDPSRLEEAAGIIAEIGQNLPVFPARGTVAVNVAGEAALAAAVEQLALADISVTELSLHLPSLDEVFFSLTAKPQVPA